MVEGLEYLVPDLAARFGEDALFRFQHQREMTVYADPNGSLAAAGTRPKEDIQLEYRWFMADDAAEAQRYEPAGNTSLEQSFTRARNWIRNCLETHTLCGKGKPTPLPTRVLDLGEEEEEKEGEEKARRRVVRLVEPPRGERGRYMCLSHSWGGETGLMTTTANAKEHLTEGIPEDRLPATFRDACDIARRLGVRYLWIDSRLVVPQQRYLPPPPSRLGLPGR
ncbi:hypothetical protein VTH82DRAFT_2438 [Thermothelomyces myriococcoides]